MARHRAVDGGRLRRIELGKLPAAMLVLTQDLHLGLVTAGWLASIVAIVAALTGFAVGCPPVLAALVRTSGTWAAAALFTTACALICLWSAQRLTLGRPAPQ